jgi:hypothetical protein
VASQITLTYCGVYSLTIVNQLIQKVSLYAQYKKEGKVFDRYTAIEMRNADRINSNMIEWTPLFLTPLWCLALNSSSTNHHHHQDGGDGTANTTSSLLTDTCVTVAWMYVGFRILYFALVCKYGVSSNGRNVPLYGATFPAYGCIVYLTVSAVRGVF